MLRFDGREEMEGPFDLIVLGMGRGVRLGKGLTGSSRLTLG